MEIKDLVDLTDALFNILGVTAVFLGGLWAYTRYVLERGILPPVAFHINCKKLGQTEGDMVMEFVVILKNIGPLNTRRPVDFA